MYLDDLVTEYGPEGRKRAEREFLLCKRIAQFLSWAVPRECAWTHFPAGGKRHSAVARKLAGMGLKAGWPDYQFVWQGRALFVEVKLPESASRLSDVQQQAHERLAGAGSQPVVCRSEDEVRDTLLAWGIPLQARLT